MSVGVDLISAREDILKKLLTITMLFISVSAALYSQYFFDNYTDFQKLDTAHAYLMVSEQFARIGDRDQAKKFREMALFIYPDLFTTIDNVDLTVLASDREKPAQEIKEGPDLSATMRYYFSKLLRSITAGDMETADSLIAERLYIPEYEGGLTKKQLAPMAAEIMKEYNLSAMAPSDLYKLNTITVRKAEEGTYYLTVQGADNDDLYNSGITFFGRVQTFRFRHFDTGWKIDKITAQF